jgi:hypothetical protein
MTWAAIILFTFFGSGMQVGENVSEAIDLLLALLT